VSATELNRALAILGVLAAGIVALMVIGIVTTGASQGFFQSARPVEAYVARIAERPLHALGLRINLGLDNLFIVVYCAFFALLSARFRPELSPCMNAVALGCLLLTALLDAAENQHIEMMLHSIEHGIQLSPAETQLQMVLSSVKFHSSYVSLFLYGFGFYRIQRLGRIIAGVLWFGYVPFGILISVMPNEYVRPFALGRTSFSVAAFLLAAILFARRPEGAQAALASSHPDYTPQAIGPG